MSSLSLERSPEFAKKLEEVRRMPQETEKESAEKREAASWLRMEVMLDNAKCARVMVQALEENPKITVAEMQAQVARQANIIYPEVATAFAAELKKRREEIETGKVRPKVLHSFRDLR